MTTQATPASSPTPTPISELLARVALAPRQTHKALTLWPLVLREEPPAPGAPAYVALSRAFEDGSVQIDELDERGAVPLVRVGNRGGIDVLFVFGEEIRGAKQNRIANASFLVAARSELVVDVSCAEQGRWRRRSRDGFAASGEIISQRMRQKMAHKVAASRRSGKRFEADQLEVWQDIEQRLATSRTASATDAYEDYVRSRRADLGELLAAFRPLERQIGFVAVAGDEILGLEAIGRPEVFADRFEGLVRGYAIDAIDSARSRRERRAAAVDSPEAFLAAIARAPASGTRSLGLGDDLRLEGDEVSGCALVSGQLVHLTAFPIPAASGVPDAG